MKLKRYVKWKRGYAGIGFLLSVLLLAACSTEVKPPEVDLANQAVPAGAAACFYVKSNFRASSFCEGGDTNITGLDRFNDRITSVRVASGYEVVLYPNFSFKGRSLKLTRDNVNLTNEDFNNRVSSLKVRKVGGGPTSPKPPGGVQGEVLKLVNQARRSGYNCDSKGRFGSAKPLTVDSRLTRASQKHADYLVSLGGYEISHTGRGGSSAGERISAEGYRWSRYGENVAAGYATPKAVVQGWLKSDGHCANIMNPDVKEIGIGVAGSGIRKWVQVFATER